MRDVSGLSRALPGRVLTREADLLAYAYDGSLQRERPEAVVLARDAAQVQAAVRWCLDNRVPYLARGAGTNLAGSCVPLRGGVVISTAAMNRVLTVDTRERTALVEPGVVNLKLQERLGPRGLFYAPDPASYRVCTLGGNVGENAGGPRCLKYGVTTNHVRALEAVMPDGSLERFSREDAGPELLSLLVGSEGTLGTVTKILVDLMPVPEGILTLLAAFPSIEAAMACVGAIISSGTMPRVLEAMDRLTVESIEAFAPAGYPRAEAVLLIELEGPAGEPASRRELDKVSGLCRAHGVTEFRSAKDSAERDRLWEGRRAAYAALARLAPNVMVEDGVVPRSRLAEAAVRARAAAAAHGARMGLLFHAGDGNLHPNMIFDERDAEQTGRVQRAGREILRACVELGGSLSGEHGIGLEKRKAMTWLFPEETLGLFSRIKRSIDPEGLANPDKVIPLPGERMEEGLLRPPRPFSDPARSLIDAVRERAARGRPFAVFGSRSKVPAEVLAAEGPEALTTRPLSSILRLEREDLVVSVECGIRMSDLKAKLEPEGFYVPLPLAVGTLGGMLAVRPWPGARDAILGMRVLLADGSTAELGGSVVKNVAGYDVPRLLLGSWGSLAVMLDVTLKLSRVRPEVPNSVAGALPPAFGAWQRRLKEAFDPKGLLNPWVGS